MSKIYNGALELVGNTPLVEVKNIEEELGLEARILVKLEYFNPAGSVKDRIAKAMIENTSRGALSTVIPRICPKRTLRVKPSSSTTDMPVYINESLTRDQLIKDFQSMRAPFWKPPPAITA